MKLDIIPYVLPEHQFLPYDSALPEVFTKVAQYVGEQAGFSRIEHIGSTAIPGMPGKNSINILVIVPLEMLPEAVRTLEAAGFAEHPFKQEPEDRPFRVGGVRFGKQQYWVHIHVVAEHSPNHLDPLFFRDYLRNHPDMAAAYAELKSSLADKRLSSEAYNAAKQPFIRDILSRRIQSDKIDK